MIDAIVTDIEGTTSSLHFVKQVLFPYAERVLADYLQSQQGRPEVDQILAATAQQSGIGRRDLQALIDQLLAWSQEDQKITALKDLQGLIWREGYERGDYRAHIYPDAVKKLREWHAADIPLYVYSSGSVAAQQLFFRYSEAGDLSGLFNGYFDTTVGQKRSTDAYRHIAERIGDDPERILFLSDVVEELNAAQAAGWRTCWVQRREDGFADKQPSSHHLVVTSFNEIALG
jgi:enolase-phosphatase E1